jgi:hypothetical protein
MMMSFMVLIAMKLSMGVQVMILSTAEPATIQSMPAVAKIAPVGVPVTTFLLAEMAMIGFGARMALMSSAATAAMTESQVDTAMTVWMAMTATM